MFLSQSLQNMQSYSLDVCVGIYITLTMPIYNTVLHVAWNHNISKKSGATSISTWNIWLFMLHNSTNNITLTNIISRGYYLYWLNQSGESTVWPGTIMYIFASQKSRAPIILKYFDNSSVELKKIKKHYLSPQYCTKLVITLDQIILWCGLLKIDTSIDELRTRWGRFKRLITKRASCFFQFTIRKTTWHDLQLGYAIIPSHPIHFTCAFK